ncbi:NUDIX domain-containing protein [Candidatus Pacearchaeota archaeon]|nr:NUDIX domain-containing protein [Candidatus Pacearchaeota archaeon]
MEEKYLFKIVIVAVIFNSDKMVLLAKRSMTEDVLPGYWGIPGGKVESRGNIPDILESEIRREVHEEVGIDIKNLRYIESHLNESGKLNICFVSEIDKGEPKPLDETEEIGWFTLKQAEEMKLTPHTLERLKLAYSL